METIAVQPPNATKIATKWALINLLTQIVITYGIQLSGVDPNSLVKFVNYIPLVAFLLLAQKEFKDTELGGYMTFGQGFSAGFRYSVFAGVLVAIFIYVYFAILSPEIFAKTIASSQTAMEEKGMSSAEVEKAMGIATKYGPIFGAFGAAIFYAIFGAIVSLIGAAILKKERTAEDILDALENDKSSTGIDPTV